MKLEKAKRGAEIIMELLDGHDVTVVQVIGNDQPKVRVHERVTGVWVVGYGNGDGAVGLRHEGIGGYYVIPAIEYIMVQEKDRSVRGVTTNGYGNTVHFAFVVTDEVRGEVYDAFQAARKELEGLK